MNCLEKGKLLLYLEKELEPEESKQIESHLNLCINCSSTLKAIQQNLRYTRAQMQDLTYDIPQIPIQGQQTVWLNIKRLLYGRKREVNLMKIKKTVVAAALILSLILVGSVPSVQTAAANFLKVFRVQNVQTLVVNPDELVQIENALKNGNSDLDIDNFGSVKCEGKSENISLGYDKLDSVGFSVKLPDGIDPQTGDYSFCQTPVMQITPDVPKINQIITSLGSNYLLPESLDGQTFSLKTGASLVATYQDFRVIQGPAPELEVPENVSVADVAEALTALPIWPENIKRQLAAVNDWEHTVLIPGQDVQNATVNHQNAVLINDNNYPSIIWQEDGKIYSIEDLSGHNLNLIKLAESLR